MPVWTRVEWRIPEVVKPGWIAKMSREVRHTIYMAPRYAGLVLEDREYNMRDDSEFYANVWNPESGKPERVVYGYTGLGGSDDNYCEVDATPEVKAAASAWYRARAAEAEAERAAIEAARPDKGKTLKVVKGRKVPKGTVGVCIWIGEGGWGKRVGLKDAAGEVHWTAATNVEVVPIAKEG